jgi:DNA-binding transcriptional LysR family regulator
MLQVRVRSMREETAVELREIRVFLVVAEELHFTRAAVRLRVAQSAVSHAIKKLEAEIGVELLERTKRSVTLTAAGEQFRARVGESVSGLERAVQAARRAAAGDVGRLVLRFTLTTALTIVPRALARFQRSYPDVELDIQPGGSTAQLEAIRLGRCDIGFMALARGLAPLATEIVQRAPLVALFPASHPLANRSRVRFADLAGEKFILLHLASEPQVRAHLRGHCLDAGFEPNVVLEIEQLEVLLAMVAAGVGISCAPALVQGLQFSGVVTVPIAPTIAGGISAVWNPAALSAAGRNFLKLLWEERAVLQAARPPAESVRTGA